MDYQIDQSQQKPSAFNLGHIALVISVALVLFAFVVIKNHGTLPFVKSKNEGQPITVDMPNPEVLGDSVSKNQQTQNPSQSAVLNIRGPVILPRGEK